MKKVPVIIFFLAATWSLGAAADEHGRGGSGGSISRSNHSTGRPQTAPHPTLFRPAEHRPIGGNNRDRNIPAENRNDRAGGGHEYGSRSAPVMVPGHEHEVGANVVSRHDEHPLRPVHIDIRDHDAIRRDRFTVHFRPGIREEWRPIGFVSPAWEHYHPVLWWDVFPNNYTWWNVNAVTCQAHFLAADPANPDNGDIFTADSVYREWHWGTHDETIVANRTLDEALDECYAATVNRGEAGTCQPVENPDDNDGCFLTYGPH
jgi:hypothetical protein